MSLSKLLFRFALACAGTLLLIVGCVAWFPGVWLPDLAGHVTDLCSAESQSGEKFRVTQFWGDDFYTIRFDHLSPDGSSKTQVIECDAMKHWRSCSMQLAEGDKKLVIDLHDGHALIDYRWAEKRFILPPGRQRLRD
jgi:hypothetical protein